MMSTEEILKEIQLIVDDKDQWDIRIYGSMLARTTLRDLLRKNGVVS